MFSTASAVIRTCKNRKINSQDDETATDEIQQRNVLWGKVKICQSPGGISMCTSLSRCVWLGEELTTRIQIVFINSHACPPWSDSDQPQQKTSRFCKISTACWSHGPRRAHEAHAGSRCGKVSIRRCRRISRTLNVPWSTTKSQVGEN